MEINTFTAIAIIIGSGAILAYISSLLKQPLIIGYVLAGIIIGPILGFIDPVSNQELIRLFSEIGIAFLLFSVGLEVDISRLKRVGLIATLGGLARMGLSFSIGYFVANLIGLTGMQPIYFGLMLSFGSTMVVIKLLSDNKELDTLHGRIVVGILLMEDFIAITSLTILANTNNLAHIIRIIPIIRNLTLLFVILLLARLLLPLMFKQAATNTELLFVLSTGIAMIFAIIFPIIGFPMSIGVFLAGLLLGNLPYSVEISGRVKPLKDFFMVLFFVSLGLSFTLVQLSMIWRPLLIVVLLALILNPIIIGLITMVFGYTSKTAFFSGSIMGEVSEFALILLTQGLVLGHIDNNFYSLGILAAIITMSITPYTFKYRYTTYKIFKPALRMIERIFRRSPTPDRELKPRGHEVILIGYDRLGYGILRRLIRMKKDFIVVDYNPDVISRLIEHGIPCIYGDISDPETLEELNLKKAKMIISTAPSMRDNLFLIEKGKKINKDLIIIVTAQTVEEALGLYKAGADYVILPHLLGGEHAGILLEEVGEDLDKLIATKIQHIKELRLKKELHPRHL